MQGPGPLRCTDNNCSCPAGWRQQSASHDFKVWHTKSERNQMKHMKVPMVTFRMGHMFSPKPQSQVAECISAAHIAVPACTAVAPYLKIANVAALDAVVFLPLIKFHN